MASSNFSEEFTSYYSAINDPSFWLSSGVVGLIQCAVIVIANFGLLLTTYIDPQKALRTPPCLLIANLSAADLMLGVTVVFLGALRDVYRYQLLPDKLPSVLVPVVYIILGIGLFVSSGSIIAMSASCYVAINSPVQYQTKITNIRVLIFIAALWIASIIMCLLGVALLPEVTYSLAFLHTHVSFPAILLTVVFVNVFRALARKTRELQLSENDSAMNSRHALERERTMAAAILIVLALFYITYLPQFITLHLLYLCSPCRKSRSFFKTDVIASRFLFVNSAINPFIYAWRVPKYRRSLIDCWTILKSRVVGRSGQSLAPALRPMRNRQIRPYANKELFGNQPVQRTQQRP